MAQGQVTGRWWEERTKGEYGEMGNQIIAGNVKSTLFEAGRKNALSRKKNEADV